MGHLVRFQNHMQNLIGMSYRMDFVQDPIELQISCAGSCRILQDLGIRLCTV